MLTQPCSRRSLLRCRGRKSSGHPSRAPTCCGPAHVASSLRTTRCSRSCWRKRLKRRRRSIRSKRRSACTRSSSRTGSVPSSQQRCTRAANRRWKPSKQECLQVRSLLRPCASTDAQARRTRASSSPSSLESKPKSTRLGSERPKQRSLRWPSSTPAPTLSSTASSPLSPRPSLPRPRKYSAASYGPWPTGPPQVPRDPCRVPRQ
mmetsp:Transcript_42251/g.99172  ORF Transcript_42251/g.99172 Transcript_42251/m.99172 type:complete len:205 (-) Transcript_42251:366-980(-)